jgi:hypothetical protein
MDRLQPVGDPGVGEGLGDHLANTPLALTTGEVDLLATSAAAAAWLIGRGLAPPGPRCGSCARAGCGRCAATSAGS